MFIGPHGVRLLAADRVIDLFATIGLVYLMFSAGLELDLQQFSRVRYRAMLFGLFTFTVPLLAGILTGHLMRMGWDSAILLGSIYASHTLVAFPIVAQLGVVSNEAVSVAIGATIFTDIGSLLVLAIVAGAQNAPASVASILWLIVLMIGYTLLILIGMPRVGKSFFRRFSGRTIEFQFVLVALFVAALVAERIGMHAIVGAFLAGLAINSTLPPRRPVISQVLFLGESLFIPIFLMYIGMLTDPLAIVTNAQTLFMGVLLTTTLYVTKFIAAWITARIFHYSKDELLTMWGLSQAQAAATLAAILVGVELNLFPSVIFNGAILMIMCTSLTSPVLVQRFGSALSPAEVPQEKAKRLDRILVPIANPHTQEHLLTMASILASSENAVLLPLHVAEEVRGRVPGLALQQQLLDRIPQILGNSPAQVQPLRRVDTSIAKGILHAALEYDVSLIVMGWRGRPTLRQSIFGTVLDEVVWEAHMPVLVGRISASIYSVKRVLLILPGYRLSPNGIALTLDMTLAIVRALNVPLHILAAARYTTRIKENLDQQHFARPYEIAPLGKDLTRDIKSKLDVHDLVVIPTIGERRRFRSSLGQLPESLCASTTASIVVIHYP
ncbi:MAG: cation:proton antiporter [Anaerolineae bacterium]